MNPGQTLLDKVETYLNSEDCKKIERALDIADRVHHGFYRLDGNPYFHHATAVAEILASWKAPKDVLIAGILHDVLYEQYSSLKSIDLISDTFGLQIVQVIREVTRLGHFGSNYPASIFNETLESIESIAKYLPWVATTLRRMPTAVIIRIANQLDNCDSVHVLTELQQKIFAKVTMNIFVPFAGRLGMQLAKRQLADVAFCLLEPNAYKETKERFPESKVQEAAESVLEQLKEHISTCKLKADVRSIPVSLYSLYRRNLEQENILPLHLVRPYLLLVEDTETCYKALGVVHKLWRPQHSMIQDYIAAPKENGYRAIHTRVRYKNGETALILIRDQDMDLVAEYGLVAKWLGVEDSLLPLLPQWNEPPVGKIAVFTIDGDIKFLIKGSTPIDFAYAVHRGLGHQCTGALVNGRPRALDSQLETGDVVRILTSTASVGPSPDWLEIAKTSKARHEIRRWLKSLNPDEVIQKGQNLITVNLRETQKELSSLEISHRLESTARRMGYESKQALLMAVGLGHCRPEKVVAQLPEGTTIINDKINFGRPLIASLEKLHSPYQLAGCCNPFPPDPIAGYMTQRNKIMTHRENCSHIRHREPLLAAVWDDVPERGEFSISITAHDYVGLAASLSSTVSHANINMISFQAYQMKDGSARAQIDLGDLSISTINSLLKNIQQIPSVHQVRLNDRITGKGGISNTNLNPYTLLPVYGKRFYGRQEELRELINNLRGISPGEAVLVWGPKRIGKTSLLMHFQNIGLSLENYVPVFIDMHGLSGSSTARFLYRIMEGVATSTPSSAVTAPRFNRVLRDPLGYFQTFIEQAVRAYDKQLVLIFDEFQLLIKLKEEEVRLADINSYFRSLVRLGSGVNFIFSGAGMLKSLLNKANTSALLEVLHHQEIGCLSLKDAKKLIIDPVKHINYEPTVISQLLDLTAGHPYYLQLICGELVSHAARESASSINNQHLDYVLMNWLPSQGEQSFSNLWGDGIGIDTGPQYKYKLILTAIAHIADEHSWVDFDQIAKSGVYKAVGESELWQLLEDLIEMRALECDGHARNIYRIKIKLCERWIYQNYSLQSLLKGMDTL